jgi:hypothetical protein
MSETMDHQELEPLLSQMQEGVNFDNKKEENKEKLEEDRIQD